MRFLYSYRWLIVIIVIASILRLWKLGIVPPSPDWDEAALGYNAYSLLKTGRDEYGTKFPIVLRSFDDYKPPLYTYLAVPSVAVFGLSTFSVRLPSAILGTLAVIGTYVLVRELTRFSDKKNQRENNHDLRKLPYITSFLLAISPWHIQFSRIAFEANVGLAVTIWASALFLYGLRKPIWIILSAFLFGLSLYAYHSQRIFSPLLVLLLLVIFRNDLKNHIRQLITAAIVGFIVIIPILILFTDKTALMRLRGTSSLADQTNLLAQSVKKLDKDIADHNQFGILFDNRRIVWLKTVVSGYMSHYSLRWLFLTGDNARHHAPDMGLLYIWELPFFLIGLAAVFAKGGKLSKFIYGWFLIAPIAASPTTELPHSIRTLVFLPTFQVFTAYGLLGAFSYIKTKHYIIRNIFMSAVVIISLFSICQYLSLYFVHLNHEYSKYWQYGYQDAVDYVKNNGNKYKKIIVSTKLEQPHMFFLFFLRYDPVQYLKEGGTKSGGFDETKNSFDKYEFRPIRWEKELKNGEYLYIGLPSEIPAANLRTIRYLDGSEAIHIADR